MTKCKIRVTAEEASQRWVEGLLRVDMLCAHCRAHKVPGPCKKCGAKKN
jgi:hypothetical protein